jgi:hypothetical protein
VNKIDSAFFVEDLNPAISAIRHVDIPLRIGGDVVRGVELPCRFLRRTLTQSVHSAKAT